MLQRSSDYDDRVFEAPVPAAASRWQQPGVDLREMARILWRRWKTVAAVPLLLVMAQQLMRGRAGMASGPLSPPLLPDGAHVVPDLFA